MGELVMASRDRPLDLRRMEAFETELRTARQELGQSQRAKEKHRRLIARVHESLLPRPVRHARIEIDTRYVSMEDVGGDYCQVLFSGDSTCYITICDVMGHGFGPALLATRVSSEVRRLAMDNRRPMEIVQRLNAFIFRYFFDTDIQLSFFVARIDLERQTVAYSGAGHPGPLLIQKKTGQVEVLRSQHLLLGVEEDCLRGEPEETVTLHSGDRLIFYTDGLTETRNAKRKCLGEAGLAAIAAVLCAGNVAEVADCILQRVVAFRAGPVRDDMTLIVAEMK